MLLISTEEKLKERIKELTCLYEISTLVGNPDLELENVLSQICLSLRKAWRFAEEAAVELVLEDMDIAAADIPEPSVYQESEINVFGNKVGSLKVHYPSPRFNHRHFMDEEARLLEKAAHEIGLLVEKKRNKEKEELLQRSIERNDRLTILGEITAGIAHELNTPLGNILGFAELIAEKTRVEQIKEDSKKIIDAAIFSREVVKKLMFFACEMPQQMESKLVPPIISEALKLLGPSFKKAEIDYVLTGEDEDIKFQFDSIQLTQVLFNILINAIYVSPAHSTIQIKMYKNGENAYLEISDEGPGIPDENKSKIFEPFFSTKPLGEGSGLGLSVVHGIIKGHRGEIKCFDNKPKGTVFQIILPLKTN